MHPILIAAAAVAAGGAYWLYDKNKKYQVPGQTPGATQGVVSELTKGRSYTVVIAVNQNIDDDPRWASFEGASSASATSDKVKLLISSTFEQSGCKMLSQPMPRSEVEMSNLLSGKPSQWVFNMQWQMDDKYISRKIDWIDNALFVLLPT